jgi:hypothetical protein
MAKDNRITAGNDNAPVEREVVAQAESMLLDGMKPVSVARWLGVPIHVVHSINRRMIIACAAAMVVGGCTASVDDTPGWSLVVTRNQ